MSTHDTSGNYDFDSEAVAGGGGEGEGQLAPGLMTVEGPKEKKALNQ